MNVKMCVYAYVFRSVFSPSCSHVLLYVFCWCAYQKNMNVPSLGGDGISHAGGQ